MMRGARRAAEHAIRELAARPFVFSAHEVAALADLTRDAPAVEEALRMRCLRRDIVLLGGARAGRRGFLGRDPALRWWCRYTARLARLGINRLTPAQLRAAMALAFDRRGWDALPANLLDIGRQAGMVADGASDALVFPWAVLLQTNPACFEAYQSMFFHQSPPDGLRGVTLDTILDKALARLPERQGDIMRKRCGLDGEFFTLERLGARHQVTRERIRQIQTKASRQIAQPSFQLALWWAFVSDFMRGGCSLVIPDAQLTPQRRFLYKTIKLNASPVSKLNLQVIGPAQEITDYCKSLRRDSLDEAAADAPPFLSERDRETLVIAEKEYREKRTAKSMSRMILKALRELKRAAHYTEIADRCNELFPENERSAHNWHAALSRFAGEQKFGIVWIGRKGMYGLKEHGYSRPAEGLFAVVPRIVREQFAATNRPVSLEAVLRELSKQRREFKPNSVAMVLIFSDQIEKKNNNYIPAAPEDAGAESKYDISAAMRAFTADRRGTGDG